MIYKCRICKEKGAIFLFDNKQVCLDCFNKEQLDLNNLRLKKHKQVQRCLKCYKPLRDFNKSGYCSSCISRYYYKDDIKVKVTTQSK